MRPFACTSILAAVLVATPAAQAAINRAATEEMSPRQKERARQKIRLMDGVIEELRRWPRNRTGNEEIIREFLEERKKLERKFEKR